MFGLKAAAAACFAAVLPLTAGVAAAEPDDPSPSPSSSDVSSLGSVGDATMGASAGMGGWASWSPLGRVETSGWPVSRTQISSPLLGNYDATTDYNLAEGEVEHWSSLNGNTSVEFHNWAEYYYGEDIEQEADVRFGSQQLRCVNFSCKMVN